MSELTIFDRILKGEIPADILYQDDDVVAFRDIQPVAPVHVLVIPRSKFASLIEARDQDPLVLGRLMQGISRVAASLGLDADGYRVVFNSGRNAQQSVAYVHAHVIGGRALGWPPG